MGSDVSLYETSRRLNETFHVQSQPGQAEADKVRLYETTRRLNETPLGRNTGSGSDIDLFRGMMDQMAQMQCDNRAELDRRAEQQDRERQQLLQSIATVSARVEQLATQRVPLAQPVEPVAPPPVTLPNHVLSNPVASTSVSCEAHPRSLEDMVGTKDNTFPAGQPNVGSLSPEELARDPDPVKSLRRDDATASVADHIMRVVGILGDATGPKKAKSAYSKHILRKKIAKWPNDYIFRMYDDEPSYDSLTPSEFMSGYMTIIEEALPDIPDVKAALKHIHYARNLMEDVPQSNWKTVRTAHRQVLMAIDYKRIKWEDTDAVYKTKADALIRCRNESAAPTAPVQEAHVAPCHAFQSFSCNHEGDHIEDEKTMLHYCSYCYAQGKKHTHPLVNCRKHKESLRAKNSRAPRPNKAE